jgi:HEAT repeat protein
MMQMQASRVVGLDPALEVLQKGIDQGSEHKISSHLLLEAMDRQGAGLEILHKDLFDSSAPVVLSALAVLGRIRDPRSVKLIVRLLTGQDENIQTAAVQALQAIGLPTCTRIISDLFKISKSDRVRCAILEALATLAPKDVAVLAIIRDCSSSQLASAEIRARAAGLYVRLEGEPAAELLLESHKSEIVEAVYGAARQSREISEVAVRHGSSRYHRLSMTNRRLLVTLAGESSAPSSDSILLKGLTDIDPEVRRAAYQVLGAYPSQRDYYPQLIGALGERVDPVLTLEEEALAAIERMESQLDRTK